MTKLCEICGRDMERNGKLSTALGVPFSCPATPDQHRIAALEKQVAELEAEIEARGPVAVTKRVTPDGERIVELERLLGEAKLTVSSQLKELQDLHESDSNAKFERDEALATLRAREADCLALRKALNASQTWLYHHPREEGQRNRRAINETVLSNTSATAQEIVARIERESVEFIWKKAISCRGIHDPKVPCGTCYAALDEIRKFCAAGILGAQPEKEKP